MQLFTSSTLKKIDWVYLLEKSFPFYEERIITFSNMWPKIHSSGVLTICFAAFALNFTGMNQRKTGRI